MAEFQFIETGFQGLWVVEPTNYADSRGSFMESYNRRVFSAHGIDTEFVQDNISCSEHNVLRGMHYQKQHAYAQLVGAAYGEIQDVAVDIRPDSATFGQYFSVHLSRENHHFLYLPVGFAHGFYVLSDYAVLCYKCSEYYYPNDEGGILYNDPQIGIQWEIPKGQTPILSSKDTAFPLFKQSF